MPNVGDELHHFGWNRCSSACHGPDRSHLIVPGLPLVAHPRRQRGRRPAPPRDREGHRARRARREDRLHAPAHRPLHAGRQHRHQHARRPRRPGRRRLRRPRRADVRAQGPLGERRPHAAPELRLLVPAAQERARSRPSSASPTPTRAASTSTDVGAGRYGQPHPLLGPRRAPASSRRSTSARQGLVPLEVRWLHDPEAEEGFVGAALASTMFRFHRANGSFRAEPVIEVDNEELDGLAAAGRRAGADHRRGRLDGRPLPVLLQLASRRPAPVRHLRSHQPAADRPALAWRAAGKAERQRSRPDGRAADDPAVPGRATPLRHQLAVLDLGQPVLSGTQVLADCASIARPRAEWRSTANFFVDLHDRAAGPARAHEVRLQGGDCTTEIFQ